MDEIMQNQPTDNTLMPAAPFVRPDEHHFGNDYRPNDFFWNKRQYQRNAGVITLFIWLDMGENYLSPIRSFTGWNITYNTQSQL